MAGNISKDEVEKQLGKEVMKGAQAAGKEQAKAQQGGESMQAVREMLMTALASPGIQVFIKVYRKPHMRAKEQYIGIIDYANPAAVAEYGVEYLVQDYSGGGDYRCVISSPQLGFEEEMHFSVDGEPQRPRPEREAQRMQQLQQPSFGGLPAVSPQSPFGPAGGSGFQPYGMPPVSPMSPYGMPHQMNPYMMGMPQQASPSDRVTEMAMVMMANANKPQPQVVQPGDDEEIRALREQLIEQNRQMNDRFEKLFTSQQQGLAEQQHKEELRRIEDRQREADQRHREEMAEQRRQHEATLAEMRRSSENSKGSTAQLIEAVGAVLGPVLPGLLDGRRADAAATRETFAAIMEANKGSYEASMKTMEVLLNQPKSEDRIAKMSEMVFSNMANTAGLVGTLVTGVLKENAGDSPPYWVQILVDLIDKGGDVLKVMVDGEGEGEGEYEDEQQVVQASHAQRMSPPPSMAAITAARERMLAAAEDEENQVGLDEAEDDIEGEEEEEMPSIVNFDTAMQTIFTMLATGGDLPTVAFRLWKHAASGVQAANEWISYPEDATPFLLGSLVERGELTLTDERIEETTAVLVEFFDFMEEREWTVGAAQEWAEKYNVSVKMPKAVHAAPNAKRRSGTLSTDGANGDQFGVSQQVAPGTDVSGAIDISVTPDDGSAQEPDEVPGLDLPKPPPRAEATPAGVDPAAAYLEEKMQKAKEQRSKAGATPEVSVGTPDNIQKMLDAGKSKLKDQKNSGSGASVSPIKPPPPKTEEPPITP